MQPLILAVDSGLDGAFVWMRGGVVLHHVLTRTLVTDGRIDTVGLERHHDDARGETDPWVPRIAYLEEPFQSKRDGQNNTAGYTDQCKRWGRLQGWLESWGYEVRGVQAKTWQREVLDLATFQVPGKACKPKLVKGWRLVSYADGWRLIGPDKSKTQLTTRQTFRSNALEAALAVRPEAVTTMTLRADTKAASIAYARKHFPGVELVPPRCKNPHDGLADALCIAAWATKQLNKET